MKVMLSMVADGRDHTVQSVPRADNGWGQRGEVVRIWVKGEWIRGRKER